MDKYKLKKIFTNVRVILMLVLILAAIVIINPSFNNDGVAIRSITVNSSAAIKGMSGSSGSVLPRNREILLSINNNPINSVLDYYNYVSMIPSNMSVLVKTNKQTYTLTSLPILNQTIVGYKDVLVEKINEETNETYNVTESQPIIDGSILGTQDLGIGVYKAPKSNLKMGLDIEGGTRVLLEPETPLSEEDMATLLDSLNQRLNVYGLSDMVIRSSVDLSGKNYILVEIPGANKDEVKDLLSKQGKFEAKIGTETVFLGGTDITSVCRTADCSGIDPNAGCGILSDQKTWVCRFRFGITLSTTAASKQAELTNNLDVIVESNNEYLSQDLDLYLDNAKVDSLKIGADLKGQAVTEIAISGSGTALSRQEAMYDALNNMKRLQTILITGSLPVKLNVVKTDNISPILGDEFIKNTLFIGLLSLIVVAFIIYVKYRLFRIVVPMIITMFSELVLLLGFGALSGWSLDLAAIAGIIIAIGTGVDDQIVITDETMKGEKLSGNYSWGQKIKRAFSIIFTSYFTTVAAMLFLLTAGAGLLRGFALTTIMGVTIGVLITRPAFAAVVEILLKE